MIACKNELTSRDVAVEGGVGWLPDFHAIDAIAEGSLLRLLPDWSSGSVEAHALYASHRSLSAKVRVFIDALIDHLGRPVVGGNSAD